VGTETAEGRLTHELVKPVQRLACYFNRFGVVTAIHLKEKEPKSSRTDDKQQVSRGFFIFYLPR
jgi:hypothetical protein